MCLSLAVICRLISTGRHRQSKSPIRSSSPLIWCCFCVAAPRLRDLKVLLGDYKEMPKHGGWFHRLFIKFRCTTSVTDHFRE